jgi:hypothetical protein
MRRPAELDDRDRPTFLPNGREVWEFPRLPPIPPPIDWSRPSLPPEAPVPTSPTRRFARVRAASTATKFALLAAGVLVACLAVVAAAVAVGEVWQ